VGTLTSYEGLAIEAADPKFNLELSVGASEGVS